MSTSASKAICLGDLHIKVSNQLVFETNRLSKLSTALKTKHPNIFSLYLLGDVFDKNNPSLKEIKLFYGFIHDLSEHFTNIIIIDGNHDSTTFKFLPEKDFKYYEGITEIDNIVFVGWSNIVGFTHNQIHTTKCNLLFTHARCTIPPYIIEEINFKELSEKFKLVVLGDIHSPHKPYENIWYTSEPTHNHYTKYKKTNGWLVVDTETLEVTRHREELPYKDIKSFSSIQEHNQWVKTLDDDNLYKVTITDLLDEFSKLIRHPQVTCELVPKLVIDETNEEVEIKQMVKKKVSIYDILIEHTKTLYKFSEETTSKVTSRVRNKR